jgi:hypothetical protein
MMQYVTRILFAITSVCVLVMGAQPATGQRRPARKPPAAARPTTAPPAPQMPVLPDIRNDPDVQAADVAIIANITAQELRFDAVPNPTVEFVDKAKNKTVWEAQRFNLPDKLEPGVTYRNIGIRLKITSRLADIDRIVAEALGEIPLAETNEASEGKRPTASAAPKDVSTASKPKP